jgi:mannose-1-phosphate guanylyltransferase
VSRYAMIMAGGAGTRLWPMSRRDQPKQLLPFIGGRSLLDIAAARLEGVVPSERRLICTGVTHRAAIRAAMPDFTDEQILGEPMGRDTLNAVGLTAAVLHARDPEAVFAVLTADHIIAPDDEFRSRLDLGFQLVEDDPYRFVTFAIKPTFAATGYGWVERGDPLAGFADVFSVRRFVEKPNLAAAETYLSSGVFDWNSGMFVFAAATVLESIRWYQPQAHAGLVRIANAWNAPQRAAVLSEVYPTLPKISLDYALMEPASRDDRLHLCSVPMNVRWLDVGSWPAYAETVPPDEYGNRTNARLVSLDSRNMLAVSDDANHTIAAIGCQDLIIVRTADATLVCRADQAQRVKDVANIVDEQLR